MDALPDISAVPDPGGGKLATNIVHFARTLRTAGLRPLLDRDGRQRWLMKIQEKNGCKPRR